MGNESEVVMYGEGCVKKRIVLKTLDQLYNLIIKKEYLPIR